MGINIHICTFGIHFYVPSTFYGAQICGTLLLDTRKKYDIKYLQAAI